MRQKVLIHEQNRLIAMGLEQLLSKHYDLQFIRIEQVKSFDDYLASVIVLSLEATGLEQIIEIRNMHSRAKIVILCDGCDRNTLA